MVRFVTVCLYMLFCCCCSSYCEVEDEAIHQLYARATKSFDEGFYRKSIGLFTELSEQHPFSSYESSVSLKIADAYFELGQYLDAIEAYNYFEEMYPRNKFVPHVLYNKARAYLNQVYGLNNDQVCTQKALDCYSKLITFFPKSKYACMAHIDIDICYRNLSGHEFAIGLFYYKNKKYDSAVSRFLKLISTYPDNGYHYKALLHLTECDYLISKRSVDKENR